MSQGKAYDNLLSFLDEYYPDESQTQSLTFNNYPHLQKIADLMTDLLNESERRKLKKDEIQLVIRACITLINENNDISVSEIQTRRVVKRKQLAYDSEFDDPEVMREKITDLHEQIAVYSTEMKNHQNQVDSLRDEIAELRDENDNLQRKFNELKRTREDEVSKLTVQKEGIGDHYKTAMLDLKLETDKSLNLSAQIDSIMKETNEKDEDIEKLQQKNKEQKDLLRKAKSLLKTLEARITEDKGTINRLNNQIKTLKSRSPSKRKVEKENMSLKEENNVLRDRMIELTDTNEKNLQTITELINENQKISQDLMTLTSQRENDEKGESQKKKDDNSNQDIQSNKSDHSRSTQKNSTPKQSNNNQAKSPANNKNCSNLSDFVENSSSTFNDVFESGNTKNSVANRSVNNDRENINNNNNNNDNDNEKTQEMEQSLKKIANLFKKSNIRPSQLPTISKILNDQEQLLNKFRSTIDAQARFITRLINEDYAAPYLLSKTEKDKDSDKAQNEEENENEEPKSKENNENDNSNNDDKGYPTSTVFKDEKVKEFVLKAVEDTRQVAYESLNGNDAEFDEIVLYDSIFDPEEGADLLVAEQESRGADNELAALAILLSIIIKQRKIGESDAKFLQSIYKNMSLDFDHPTSAEDATNYIDNIHQSIKKLRKFYNSEYERIDPEEDNAEFLSTFTTNISEFSPAIKESAGFKGKLIDLPDYLTSTTNRNAQNRSIDLNESGNTSNRQLSSTKSSSRQNNRNNENDEEDYDEAVDLNSFTSPENSNEEESILNEVKARNLSINSNSQNGENEEDDDSIFGERINSVPAGNSSTSNTNNTHKSNNDAKIRKLREEINNYKDEIKKLTRQLEDANTTSEVLQEAFERFHRKNEETEKNALVIIAERDRLQNLLDERDKQFDKRIKNATNHIQNQKDQEMKILKKRYEDENKLLGQKVDSRDKRLREIKKSMKEIIGMYEDLLARQRDEMRELSKKNEEAETEAKKYIREDSENIRKIAELQDKIADLVMQRSNDLSLTVTSANNSLSLENTNTQSARRNNTNTNNAYSRPNPNNTYNTRSSYNNNNNNNNNNNVYNRQNNYNNKNFSPTSVNRNFNQNNNRTNNNLSFSSRNTNNNNLSLNSSNRNNNNSGTSF